MGLSQHVLLLVPRRAWDEADPRPTGPHLDGIHELWADEDLDDWSSGLDDAFGPSQGQVADAQTVVWGDAEGTCLELAAYEGSVEELRFRVDLAGSGAAFLERLVGIARDRGLVFVTMQGAAIEPVFERVIEAAQQSVVPTHVVNDDFPEDDLEDEG